MGLSKEQVERHIAGVEKRLRSAQERAHHGYEFARLCVEVEKYKDAIRYLADYLSVQEKDFRAHKLMGQVCDKEGDLQKAVVHYNRSLQLKSDQREVARSVAKLYCKIENPPVEELKLCVERLKPFSSSNSLLLALNEKLLSTAGSGDRDAVLKLAEQQLALCKDDVAAHIRLVNYYTSAGELQKAFAHCLAQRRQQVFTESREWLTCALEILEQRYISEKAPKVDTPPNHVIQCQLLIFVLDHLILLFLTSGASGTLMASTLLKYDKVLFAALQALRAQQPYITPSHRMELRELCGQYYLLLASYMYWRNRFRTSLGGGAHTLRHLQVGNLCLLASLSFPPPKIYSIPILKELKQQQELELWHARACKRLSVVARQLLLVSKQKGDEYLGGLAKMVEEQGGKLAIIKALFTENEDLRGADVKFASSAITYNIRSSYLAAESEHLLAQGKIIQLPSENEAQLCDRVHVLHSSGDLSSLLWLCLCQKAVQSSIPVFTWLTDLYPGLVVDQPSSHVRTAAVDTLCLCDVEAMLVLSINGLQSALTSSPSQPTSLPDSLLHHLPITVSYTLEGADMVKYCQWWSCVYQWFSNTVSSVGAAQVKQTISEGLSVVRGCCPLRLNVQQLTTLAQHFQQRVEDLVDSDGEYQLTPTPLIEALLKRSGHYWEMLIDILTDRDSYRDTPKYRSPQPPASRHERGESSDKIFLTPQERNGPSSEGDQEKILLLNKARMALADAAAYKRDISRALGLYSRVKTAQAAWNQAQIYLMLGQQGSPDTAGKKMEHLEKIAETLELALSRLTPSEKELQGRIEKKHEEVKQLLSEEQHRKDVAISLHYDSSPEPSLPIPRKASTPTAGGREKQLSPFSLEKKSPSQLLSESLRAEMREKNSLIVSMSEQLKNLQAEMSALRLQLSPVARYPHPSHPHYLQQASPQAMGGLPGSYMSPNRVQMYQPHPSLASSFNSPLVHHQSPINLGMPTQMPAHAPPTYYVSPQHQITPLPPHLSPSTNSALGLSIPTSQIFRVQAPLSGNTRPQQSVASVHGFGPSMLHQHVLPSNNPPGAMFQIGSVTVNEEPLVTAASGMVYTGPSEQQLMKLQQQVQLNQQLQRQQQQPMRLPSAPIPNMGAPGLPVSSSLLPTHPNPISAGFVLKPGTYLPATSPQKQDLPKVPLLLGETATTQQSSSGDKTFPPSVTAHLTTSGVTMSGLGGQPQVSAPSSIDTSVPFTISLNPSGMYQFPMKSSLNPFLEKRDEGSLQNGTEPKTLVQTSSVSTTLPHRVSFATSTTSFSLSSSLTTTTSVVSTTSQPSLTTTTVPLYSSTTTSEQEVTTETGADQETSYDAYPDFEPIVSLPEVDDISTGEENENVLFSHRAKLYRFDLGTGAWKDRGIGDIKILEHKKSSKARIVMRREQVLKLCCNHYVTAVMSLTPLQGNNQLAWYTHCDFADGIAKPEKLAIRFKQADVTGEFQKVFEVCVAKAGRKEKDSTGGQPSPSATSLSLKERFSAPVDSWECDACLVQNQSTVEKCVACGTAKPGSQKIGSPHQQVPSTTSSVPFKSTLPVTATIGGSTSIGEHGGLNLGNLSFGTPPVVSTVTSGGFSMGCLTLGMLVSSTVASGGFSMGGLTLGTLPKFTAEPEKAADSKSEGIKLEATSHVPGSGNVGTSGGFNVDSGIFKLGGSTHHSTSSDGGTKSTGLGFPSLAETSQSTIGGSASSTVPSGGVLKPEPFLFGSASEKVNFGSIFGTTAPSSAEGGSTKQFVFGTSHDVPKSPALEEEPNESHNSSVHEPDIHFDPIVTLPEVVDIHSGEENEDALFTERAKLYRFDSNLKQWKERGLGEMKILVNRSAGKARVLMRRDLVLKICCNHFITRDMSLTPMAGGNKAWTWFTPCDFADETGQPEKLAARFKSPAIADAFKKAFEEAMEYIATSTREGVEDGTIAHIASERKEKVEPDEDEEGKEHGDNSEEDATARSSGKLFDFTAKFGPQTGSWDCESCYVSNQRDEKACCACGEPRPKDDSEEDATARSSGKLFDFAKFGPQTGSWDCNSCYVSNQRDEKACCACGEPRPKDSPPQEQSLTSASNTSEPFAFLSTPTKQMQQQIKFGARLKITPHRTIAKESSPDIEIERQSSSSRSPSPPVQTVQLEAAAVVSEDGDDVTFVGVELPSEDKVRQAEKYLLPPSFYNYETQPNCPGCRGCIDLLKGPYEPYEPEVTPEHESGSSRNGESVMKVEGDNTAKKEVEVHQFCGSNTGTSFSSLAASTNGGGIGSDSGFLGQRSSEFSGFKGAGSQLFAPKPSSTEEECDNPEAEVDINFKPVVTLEEVEVKTGEEEEECLFSHRAKLYRFDVDLRQWKERGLGDIKILKNTKTGRSRVVMRREQILKLCCNHTITPDMKLQANTSNPKSWTWKTLSDFADQTAQEETFSVRFKHMETAQQFGEIFMSCQADHGDELEQRVTPEREPTPPLTGTQNTGTEANSSCTALKETLEPSETVPKDVSSDSSPRSQQEESPGPVTPPLPPLQSTDASQQGEPLMAPDIPVTQPSDSDTGKGQQESGETDKDRPVSPQTEPNQKPLFGSEMSASASQSFADLAKNAATSGFPSFGQTSEGFQFSGGGNKLFSSDSAADEENPESEADIHFQPIVTLPEAVVIKSWDNEADTLFCHRCKLYRFDKQQWKERGVGELKIMKHRHNGKLKLIMRREKILKLCCNHSLTSVEKVTEMPNNDKACVWFTTADYSEEAVTPEKLCAKFKNSDIAREFRDTFEICKAANADDSKENDSGEIVEEDSGNENEGEGGGDDSKENESGEEDGGNRNEGGGSEDSERLSKSTVNSVPDTKI